MWQALDGYGPSTGRVHSGLFSRLQYSVGKVWVVECGICPGSRIGRMKIEMLENI